MVSYIKLTLLTYLQDEIPSEPEDQNRQTDRQTYRQISVHTLRTKGKWLRPCTLNGYHTVLTPNAVILSFSVLCLLEF